MTSIDKENAIQWLSVWSTGLEIILKGTEGSRATKTIEVVDEYKF